jgi:hypothetical protein
MYVYCDLEKFWRLPECGTLFKKFKFLVPESSELGRTVERRRPTKQLLAATCCVI